ncbi:MAG: nucleotide-diphospho-sugar transferase [Cyclobacteriaceae bacterium]|jgi:hypothetical protein
MAFATPILFIVFNRPNHTRKVLERIREIKPNFLFVAADGPRRSHVGDADKCNEVREVINRGIDWPCQVKTQYRDENLGCGKGPVQAITWFFDNVEEGIILEDDCLPDLTFFPFCEELLSVYRHQTSIMHVSGNNFQNGIVRGSASYYFSAYSHNWGWATWRRSWQKYNFHLTDLDPLILAESFKVYGFTKKEHFYWLSNLENFNKQTLVDIWDYQWGYTIWRNSGLSILPNTNLVVNIGFDSEATHTKEVIFKWRSGNQSFRKIELQHPSQIQIDSKADRYTFNNLFSRRDPIFRRVKNKMLLNPLIRWAYDKTKTFNKAI